jgi:hypothetical protein
MLLRSGRFASSGRSVAGLSPPSRDGGGGTRWLTVSEPDSIHLVGRVAGLAGVAVRQMSGWLVQMVVVKRQSRCKRCWLVLVGSKSRCAVTKSAKLSGVFETTSDVITSMRDLHPGQIGCRWL